MVVCSFYFCFISESYPFQDGFCGHRPNGNHCDVCDLKLIAHRLTDMLTHEEVVTRTRFLKTALRYILLSLKLQVYFHLGSHIQYDFLPRLLDRLCESILHPQCDPEILLDFYPDFDRFYRACLRDLSLTDHAFSTDENKIASHIDAESLKINFLKSKISFSVSLFWEDSYDKSLAAAKKSFH